LVIELEEKLHQSGQFILMADMINFEVLWTSAGCCKFYTQSGDPVDPAQLLTATHTNDFKRHALARSRLFKLALEMFEQRAGSRFMSTNFRTLNAQGAYVDLLFQVYMKYVDQPVKAVYMLQINTNVTGLVDLKHGYQFYSGNDRSYFHYPDDALLQTGNVFSKREFEVLKAIAEGLESQEIAEKLFLSTHTVNTHRRNILIKSGKRTTHELVLDLQEQGML
jgi:DNA-binding CsgD family transcriptional regulator